LEDLLNYKNVTHLISAFTTNPDVEQLDDYLVELDDMVEGKDVQVLLTGYLFSQFQPKSDYRNIEIFQSLKDLSASI